MRRPRALKLFCEIEGCGVDDPALLHKHHIVERTEITTCNDDFNLAILCANHHAMTHDAKRLKIIGVFPSTGKSGRTLIYCLDGRPNVPGITEAYFTHRPAQMKLLSVQKEEDEKKSS